MSDVRKKMREKIEEVKPDLQGKIQDDDVAVVLLGNKCDYSQTFSYYQGVMKDKGAFIFQVTLPLEKTSGEGSKIIMFRVKDLQNNQREFCFHEDVTMRSVRKVVVAELKADNPELQEEGINLVFPRTGKVDYEKLVKDYSEIIRNHVANVVLVVPQEENSYKQYVLPTLLGSVIGYIVYRGINRLMRQRKKV